MLPLMAAQAALGIGQAIGGFIQQRKATKQLEGMQSPTYTPNQSILDYYNKSLAKYKVDPRQTDLYRMQEQNANRELSSGLSSLQSRGQALAGVNNLVQAKNDSLLKASATAEQMQGQDLNRLGQATAMKTTEDQREFEINQQQPFERKYNLKALKASGGTNIANAGISNIFGAGQSYDQINILDKMYSSDGGYKGSAALGGSGMGAASYGNNVLQQLYRNQNRRVG